MKDLKCKEFKRIVQIKEKKKSLSSVYIHSLLYILFEKEKNMNGHAVTRIYFL